MRKRDRKIGDGVGEHQESGGIHRVNSLNSSGVLTACVASGPANGFHLSCGLGPGDEEGRGGLG